MRAQNECEIRKWFPYWGGDREKCNGQRKLLLKRSNNCKERVVTHIFYVMKWQWQPNQKVTSF